MVVVGGDYQQWCFVVQFVLFVGQVVVCQVGFDDYQGCMFVYFCFFVIVGVGCCFCGFCLGDFDYFEIDFVDIVIWVDLVCWDVFLMGFCWNVFFGQVQGFVVDEVVDYVLLFVYSYFFCLLNLVQCWWLVNGKVVGCFWQDS